MHVSRSALPESPIEQQFWHVWQHDVPHLPLHLQYPACNGKYRLDFAHLPSRTAIELDGYAFHNSKASFINDRKRQRELQRDGWHVVVFSGSEVFHNVRACVDEVRHIIERSNPALGVTVPYSGAPLHFPQSGALPMAYHGAPATPQRTILSPLASQTKRRRPTGLTSSGSLLVVAGCVMMLLCLLVLSIRAAVRPPDWTLAAPRLQPTTQPTHPLFAPVPVPTSRPIQPAAETEVPQSAETVLYSAEVVSRGLNVRSAPNPTAEIIMPLKQAVVVLILEERRLPDGTTWARVQVVDLIQPIEGWVNAGYLRPLPLR